MFKCPEFRDRLSRAQVVRFQDPLERDKLRQRLLTRYRDPREREKTSKINRRIWEDPSLRQRQSQAQKARFRDPSERGKLRDAQTLRFQDPEERLKLKEAMNRPDVKAHLSRVRKELWADPDFRSKQQSVMYQGLESPTKIEVAMDTIFRARGLKFDREFQIGGYRVDFAFPDCRLVVECDGEYWHSLPGAVGRDVKRDLDLEDLGWSVIRFSEGNILRDSNKCADVVEERLKVGSSEGR